LEKDRERERKRHQEMKANPEKYAAKVEKQRERYQEKKANEPEKHAAKLEKRREGYDAEKRRKRYQVAAAAKARSKRSSVAASSASAAVVAASSQNGTGDEGSTMEIEDLLHRTFLPVPGQIGFAARMARMYLDASTDVVAEDLLRRTSLPVPGQIGFAARMAETYLRSKKKKKRAPESPAPKKRQRVNCSNPKSKTYPEKHAELSRLNRDDVIAACDPSKSAATRSYIEGLIDGLTKRELTATMKELGVNRTYTSTKDSMQKRLKEHYERRHGW